VQPYPPEAEETMRRFYNSLSEKDRRRYAESVAEFEIQVVVGTD